MEKAGTWENYNTDYGRLRIWTSESFGCKVEYFGSDGKEGTVIIVEDKQPEAHLKGVTIDDILNAVKSLEDTTKLEDDISRARSVKGMLTRIMEKVDYKFAKPKD